MKVPRVRREELCILLIDVQPVFLEYAFPEGGSEFEALQVRLEHLLMLAGWMDLPLLYTLEKTIETNGELPDRLEAVLPSRAQRFVKNYFGSMTEDSIREAVEALPGRQIAVAGAETDVCKDVLLHGPQCHMKGPPAGVTSTRARCIPKRDFGLRAIVWTRRIEEPY